MKIYVSLTSIQQKQKVLFKTLRSIRRQTLLPNRCFLYLSEEPYMLDKGFENKEVSDRINKFMSKNKRFEIKWCVNIGPYRKLLPLLHEKFNEDCLTLLKTI